MLIADNDNDGELVLLTAGIRLSMSDFSDCTILVDVDVQSVQSVTVSIVAGIGNKLAQEDGGC